VPSCCFCGKCCYLSTRIRYTSSMISPLWSSSSSSSSTFHKELCAQLHTNGMQRLQTRTTRTTRSVTWIALHWMTDFGTANYSSRRARWGFEDLVGRKHNEHMRHSGIKRFLPLQKFYGCQLTHGVNAGRNEQRQDQ